MLSAESMIAVESWNVVKVSRVSCISVPSAKPSIRLTTLGGRGYCANLLSKSLHIHTCAQARAAEAVQTVVERTPASPLEDQTEKSVQTQNKVALQSSKLFLLLNSCLCPQFMC